MGVELKVPFFRPSIDESEKNAVTRVLASGWLTTGQEALAFEEEFTQQLKQEYSSDIKSLAVQSCTAGLHLVYKALKLNKERKLIASPLNFISSVSPAIYCGAKVDFVDCAPNSMYPNANTLDALKKDKAHHIISILPMGGFHPYYDDMFEFAKERKLYTVEDAAHAYPASAYYMNEYKPYGTCADAGVFSFYANKTITTGEGGMVVSDNQDIIDAVTLYRNHGMDKISWNRFQNNPHQFSYDILDIGFKYNLPDILAAIGREQVKKAKNLLMKRRRIAEIYYKRLSERDYWILPECGDIYNWDVKTHSWHLFVLQINHPHINRDDFMQKLAEKGIGTSVHYTPLHMMTYFKTHYRYKPEDFPNAYTMFKKILSIPIYAELKDSEIEYVCNCLIEIGDKY